MKENEAQSSKEREGALSNERRTSIYNMIFLMFYLLFLIFTLVIVLGFFYKMAYLYGNHLRVKGILDFLLLNYVSYYSKYLFYYELITSLEKCI